MSHTKKKKKTRQTVRVPSPVSHTPQPSEQQLQRTRGCMFVWGENTNGELSVGHAHKHVYVPEAVHLPRGDTFAQLSYGLSHAVALSTNNKIYTCGSWVSGRLGHINASKDVHRFKRLRLGKECIMEPVSPPPLRSNREDDEGEKTTQHPSSPRVPIEDRFIHVACGHHHSVALTCSGILYTWGGNLYGKLGHVGTQVHRILEHAKIYQVECGVHHTVVCTQDQGLFSFGGGGKHTSFGQLGLPNVNYSPTPSRIHSLDNVQVVQISCGAYHTLALTDTHTVYGWGRGDFGQLGMGGESNIHVPTIITSLCPITRKEKIEEQRKLEEAQKEENNMLLFYSPIQRRSKKKQETFMTRSGVVQSVACGDKHSFVLTDEGEVFSFGCGLQGQLGHGVRENVTEPRWIQALSEEGNVVTQIAAGSRHSICLNASHEVYTWGHNDKGQLGLGSDIPGVSLPTLVPLLSGRKILQVGASGCHSLAFDECFRSALDMTKYLKEKEERKKNIIKEKEKEQRKQREKKRHSQTHEEGRKSGRKQNRESRHSNHHGDQNERNKEQRMERKEKYGEEKTETEMMKNRNASTEVPLYNKKSEEKRRSGKRHHQVKEPNPVPSLIGARSAYRGGGVEDGDEDEEDVMRMRMSEMDLNRQRKPENPYGTYELVNSDMESDAVKNNQNHRYHHHTTEQEQEQEQEQQVQTGSPQKPIYIPHEVSPIPHSRHASTSDKHTLPADRSSNTHTRTHPHTHSRTHSRTHSQDSLYATTTENPSRSASTRSHSRHPQDHATALDGSFRDRPAEGGVRFSANALPRTNHNDMYDDDGDSSRTPNYSNNNHTYAEEQQQEAESNGYNRPYTSSQAHRMTHSSSSNANADAGAGLDPSNPADSSLLVVNTSFQSQGGLMALSPLNCSSYHEEQGDEMYDNVCYSSPGGRASGRPRNGRMTHHSLTISQMHGPKSSLSPLHDDGRHTTTSKQAVDDLHPVLNHRNNTNASDKKHNETRFAKDRRRHQDSNPSDDASDSYMGDSQYGDHNGENLYDMKQHRRGGSRSGNINNNNNNNNNNMDQSYANGEGNSSNSNVYSSMDNGRMTRNNNNNNNNNMSRENINHINGHHQREEEEQSIGRRQNQNPNDWNNSNNNNNNNNNSYSNSKNGITESGNGIYQDGRVYEEDTNRRHLNGDRKYQDTNTPNPNPNYNNNNNNRGDSQYMDTISDVEVYPFEYNLVFSADTQLVHRYVTFHTQASSCIRDNILHKCKNNMKATDPNILFQDVFVEKIANSSLQPTILKPSASPRSSRSPSPSPPSSSASFQSNRLRATPSGPGKKGTFRVALMYVTTDTNTNECMNFMKAETDASEKNKSGRGNTGANHMISLSSLTREGESLSRYVPKWCHIVYNTIEKILIENDTYRPCFTEIRTKPDSQ